jgi:hypothetical protein
MYLCLYVCTYISVCLYVCVCVSMYTSAAICDSVGWHTGQRDEGSGVSEQVLHLRDVSPACSVTINGDCEKYKKKNCMLQNLQAYHTCLITRASSHVPHHTCLISKV